MNFGEILEKWDSMQYEALKNPDQQSKTKQNEARILRKKSSASSLYEKSEQEQKNQKKSDTEKPEMNPIDWWIRRYGVTDKDKIADEYAEAEKMKNREYLYSLRADARIDLHGLTRDEAWRKLEDFVEMCLERNYKKIMIIHGKGNHINGSDSVLGHTVKLFIEQNSHLGASGHPDKRHGGSGATWVLLK